MVSIIRKIKKGQIKLNINFFLNSNLYKKKFKLPTIPKFRNPYRKISAPKLKLKSQIWRQIYSSGITRKNPNKNIIITININNMFMLMADHRTTLLLLLLFQQMSMTFFCCCTGNSMLVLYFWIFKKNPKKALKLFCRI